MPLSAKLESNVGQSDIAISDVTYLNAEIDQIRGLGVLHYLNAANSQSAGGYTRAKDMANRNVEVISTYSPAPVIDTAINSRPTLTFGSGGAGIVGQTFRPQRYGALDVGTGAWSMCFLLKVTGTSDVLVGPERVAKMESLNYSPFLRFGAVGGQTQAPILADNNNSARSSLSTHEFYNTDRLLLVCQTPGVGVTWYVDDWDTPIAATSDAAKAQLTDGKFVLCGRGDALSSLSFCGSIAVFTAHNVDLSTVAPQRRDFMQALATYGGI
ncbi:MAG: hypothetical protein H5U22_06380 [Rhizobium sp.]|nr:hypothetical protein [Rhizobium sp.]